MITESQQMWLDHLNDADSVVIMPWDPMCDDLFQQIKTQIQNLLGSEQAVEHRGASSLKISGQNEIDVYIPVAEERYDETVDVVKELYETPRSNYPRKRARFVVEREGKRIEIFVINESDNGWKDAERFYHFLLSHPKTLEEYRKLKESASGKSTKAYYTEKVAFINEVLARANASE